MDMRKQLWQYVNWMLNEGTDSPNPADLLIEPDFPEEEEEQEEQSVVANISGATTPLGTGPTYPNKSPKVSKRKTSEQAAGDSFGGARPHKKSKNS